MESSPLKIECSSQPLDFSLHPDKSSILAVALVDGTVEIHDYNELLNDEEDADSIVASLSVAEQSARCVLFSKTNMYASDAHGKLVWVDAEVVSTFGETSKISGIRNVASPIHVIHAMKTDGLPNVNIVTGDDAGVVKLWDPRQLSSSTDPEMRDKPRGCVHSWKTHSDYVSSFQNSNDGNTLLAASADCTISVYDLRMASESTDRAKYLKQSDDQEDELLSMLIMKGGKKVVCGTGEGVLSVFSWGTWGDISDRYPGFPSSIDALAKVDEDTLLAGTSDGKIRYLSIQPDKEFGVLGTHEGFPIEKLEFTTNREYVASLTHDNFIRLWSSEVLNEASVNQDVEEDISEDHKEPEDSIRAGSDDEWEGMDEAMLADDSDDDPDESQGSRKRRKKNAKGNKFKSTNEKFFEDL